MRVALLKPPIGGIIGLEMITFVEPLGLECVAGTLEPQGHQCKIVDLRIDGLERGMARTRAFRPQVVGLQCNFTTERFRTIRVAQRVKREMPDVLVLVGGHDASRDPDWFQHPDIDIVAVGDGEEIVAALMNALERGEELTGVPGLMLNGADGPTFTGPAPARGDIDELPFPSRHLIREYAGEYYINFRKPLALLETARGCPYRCNFCSVWKFHEKSFREKSPERVVQELSQIEAPNVFITDDIFWMNVQRGEEMARQIKASGIRKKFTLQTRTDIICRFPELIEMWKDCGHMTIFLGLEKIDDEGLDSVNKNNVAANNDRALEILKELGVGYTPNFIVDPSWGREDFAKLPGTDLWDDVKDDVNTEDWELFDIAHTVLPTKLPLEEFYAEYAGLWRHALDVRFKIQGRLSTQMALLAALATRKVTLKAMRKGMNLNRRFSTANTFLRAHRESAARLAEVAASTPTPARRQPTGKAPAATPPIALTTSTSDPQPPSPDPPSSS